MLAACIIHSIYSQFIDQRTTDHWGHLSVFQCIKRSTWSLYVRLALLLSTTLLCVNCSKWFLQKLGHKGLLMLHESLTGKFRDWIHCFILTIQYLHLYTIPGLNNLLAAYEDKTAYALCTIAYHSGQSDSSVVLFEGKTMVRDLAAKLYRCTILLS